MDLLKNVTKMTAVIAILFTVLIVNSVHAQANSGDLRFEDSRSDWSVEVVAPRNLDLRSNYIRDLEFEVYYDGVYYRDAEVTVGNQTSSNFGRISVPFYDTGLTRSNTYRLNVKIESEVHEDGNVDIELSYNASPIAGASFMGTFEDGRSVSAFNNLVSLDFPRDSYLLSEADGIIFELDEQERDQGGFAFISQTFELSGINRSSGDMEDVRPSHGSELTISYTDSINQSTAIHNLTIVKEMGDRWIPIGGVVDSRRQTVTAPIYDLNGRYAVALNYNTFGIDDTSRWSYPYVIGLAYKGVMLPYDNLPYFENDELEDMLGEDINRLDFAAMMVRAMGYAPAEYNNHFGDIADMTFDVAGESGGSNTDLDQGVTLTFNTQTADVRKSLTLTFPNEITHPELLTEITINGDRREDFSVEVQDSDMTITLDSGTFEVGDEVTIPNLIGVKDGDEWHYYAESYDATGHIMAAVRKGLIQGRGRSEGVDMFGPADSLTRQEAAIIISRVLDLRVDNYTNLDRTKSQLARSYPEDFTNGSVNENGNGPVMSDWAIPHIAAVTRARIMEGNGSTFNGSGELTVEQAATLTYRIMDNQNLFGR